MRVLLVSSAVPFPGEPGSPRTYRMAQVIAAEHEISLLLIDQTGDLGRMGVDNSLENSPFARAKVIEARPSPSPFALKLLNAICLKPWFSTDMKRRGEHARALDTIRELSREADVVWVDGLSMLQYLETCDAPFVLDLVDLISRLDLAQSKSLKPGPRKLIETWQALMVRRYERRHLAEVGTVVLNSEVDAHFMLGDIGVRAEVVVNGCDISWFTPRKTRGELIGDPALLFVGNYSYPPNFDAARYIIDSIAPLLAEAFPGAVVHLVGPIPAGALDAAPPYVQVVGFAPDTRDYYSAADAFICPLRFGAGVKNKILEAAAMECPIVASPVSMEGLAFDEGVHFLRAEAPAEFVDKVGLLLEQDAGVARSLARNARELVETKYSWTSAGKRLGSLLVAAAQTRRR